MWDKINEFFDLKERRKQLDADQKKFEADKAQFVSMQQQEQDRDFAALAMDLTNAFSIERISIGSSDERTIVGYMKSETSSKVKEWNLYISKKCHNNLCEKASELLPNIHFISGS